ncbi:hypothetical protein SK128_021212 [Halocaridina rubra]|uniref:Uncharacterized protein n=1 Tax=Halocaridina rubra TaxID=373956 RepID=A0AAN8XM00_HALRR
MKLTIVLSISSNQPISCSLMLHYNLGQDEGSCFEYQKTTINGSTHSGETVENLGLVEKCLNRTNS